MEPAGTMIKVVVVVVVGGKEGVKKSRLGLNTKSSLGKQSTDSKMKIIKSES